MRSVLAFVFGAIIVGMLGFVGFSYGRSIHDLPYTTYTGQV